VILVDDDFVFFDIIPPYSLNEIENGNTVSNKTI
jgi:hypothetical protein